MIFVLSRVFETLVEFVCNIVCVELYVAITLKFLHQVVRISHFSFPCCALK
jgi:hypothetical protein